MIIWKIVDEGCPICAEMSKFDKDLILSMGFGINMLMLEHAAGLERLATYIKSEVMDSDGTVDIPMYILEVDGEFTGAIVGYNTKGELKRKLLMISP